MGTIKMRTFSSVWDFGGKFFEIFRGATFFMTYSNIKGAFREKIKLTVAIANNCHG